MKAKEELTALKEESEALNRKLAALNAEELRQVSGGEANDDWDTEDVEAWFIHKHREENVP